MRTHCPVCGRDLCPDLQPSLAWWSSGMRSRRRPPWVSSDWIKSICGGCQERFAMWLRRRDERLYWVEDNQFNFNVWLAVQLNKDLKRIRINNSLRVWCREVTAYGPCSHEAKYENGFCMRHEPGVYTVAGRTGRMDRVAAGQREQENVKRRRRIAERAYLRKQLFSASLSPWQAGAKRKGIVSRRRFTPSWPVAI
jgi:hypothetical protein